MVSGSGVDNRLKEGGKGHREESQERNEGGGDQMVETKCEKCQIWVPCEGGASGDSN